MSTTIAPTTGAGVLFTQQGVGTSPGYAAIDDRRAMSLGGQEGVINDSDYMVTQHGAGAMTVDLSMNGGGARVQGDSVTAQGLYTVPVHSGIISETISPADATNPRVDQVILEVLDNVHDASGSNLARTRVVAGTPTAGATLTNRTGVAALPGSALLLADVLVGAGVASITNSVIRDRRKWARGAYSRTSVFSGYTTASATLTQMDTTNLKPRIECSGAPIRLVLDVDVSSAAAGKQIEFDLFKNGGTSSLHRFDTISGSGSSQRCVVTWQFLILAGSYQFSPAFASPDNTTTLTAAAAVDEPITFVIEELVRSNSVNNSTTTG